MHPEKKVWTLFSLLNMESPKVQKVSHWLSKKHNFNRNKHQLYIPNGNYNQQFRVKNTFRCNVEVDFVTD